MPLCDLNPNVPTQLAALIHRLLGRNPDDRPATCEDVIRELRLIERDYADDRMATTAILSAQADIRVTSDATPQLEPASTDLGYEVIDDLEATEVIAEAIGKPKRKKASVSSRKMILAFSVGATLAAASVYGLTSGTTKTDTPATPTLPSPPLQSKDENERRPGGPEFHRPGEPWLDAEGRPIPPPPPHHPRPPFPKHPPGKGWPPPPRP